LQSNALVRRVAALGSLGVSANLCHCSLISTSRRRRGCPLRHDDCPTCSFSSRRLPRRGIFFMEPLEEDPAALGRGRRMVAVGPQGGDVVRLAGRGRPINLVQSGLGFPTTALFRQGVEEILSGMGAEDVWLFFRQTPPEAQVLVKGPASQGKIVGAPRTRGHFAGRAIAAQPPSPDRPATSRHRKAPTS